LRVRFIPLLDCSDLNISISEPFRNIYISPGMTFDSKLTILDEYNEARNNTVSTTGQLWRVAHNSFDGKVIMLYCEKVAAARVIILD
jgi:hypothetical protein